MKNRTKLAGLAALGAIALTGCGPATTATESEKAEKEINQKADARSPYQPVNDVEFKNYNKSQELYDDPSAIQWCTIQPEADTAPMVTVPIAGKLTSSSTSFYPGQEKHGWDDAPYLLERRSVDGMYHGSPAPYRYGFTPAGDYVSFEGGVSFVCTTSLMEWQKTTTEIDLTGKGDDGQKAAEEALAKGDTKKANEILKGVVSK